MKKKISVTLSEELGLKLKEYADGYGVTQSEVIRLLIVNFLNEEEADLCRNYNQPYDECIHGKFLSTIYNLGKAK